MSNTIENLMSFPLGASVRLEDLDRNPYPLLRRLQQQEPVSWVPELEMWFVTMRADVIAVLKDPETYTTDSARSPIREIFGSHMLSTDGPGRHRYKSHCVPFFSAKHVQESHGKWIEAKVHRLIDEFAVSGSADLLASFASPLAFHTVAHVLGIPSSDFRRVRAWYDDFAVALANFTGNREARSRGLAAASAFREYMSDRLRSPAGKFDSLLGALVSDTRDPLNEEEILSNALIILFGGIETTESMILNTIWALFTHPEQAEDVYRDPDLVPCAIEETLRWEPPVQSCTRYVKRSTVLRGVNLKPGNAVQCMLGAANRDPAYFEDPDRFDLHRANAADHLSFGTGAHFCLGAPLARLETKIGLCALFERLPELSLDPAFPAAPLGYEFRKPPSLKMCWRASASVGRRAGDS